MSRIHEVLKQRRYIHFATLLETGIEINTKDEKGRTLLMMCCFREETMAIMKVLKQLLCLGADVSIRDNSGVDVLSHAAMESRPRILHILLSESDAELRRQDRDGRTALHHAVRVANVPVVSLLISYLRRFRLTLDDIDCRGMTALMMAECQGSRDIARLLEIAGASQTMRDDVRFWNSEQWSRGDGCRGVESCEYDRRQLNSTTPQLLNRQRTAFRVAVHATRTPDVRQRSRVRSAPPRPLFSSDPGTSRRSYPRRLEDTWAAKSYGGGRAECSGSTGKSLRKRAVSCPVGMAYPSSQATPPFLNALFHCYSVQSSNSFRQPAPPYIQLEMEEADESNSDHEQSDGTDCNRAISRVQKVVEKVKRADRVLRNVRRLLAGPIVHVTPPDTPLATPPQTPQTSHRQHTSMIKMNSSRIAGRLSSICKE